MSKQSKNYEELEPDTQKEKAATKNVRLISQHPTKIAA